MDVALIGFGSLSKNLLKILKGDAVLAFDIKKEVVGKEYEDLKILPGIFLDKPPRAFKSQVVSVSEDDFKKFLVSEAPEIAVLSLSAFSKRSAMTYAKILNAAGVLVIDATQICVEGALGCYVYPKRLRELIAFLKRFSSKEEMVIYEIVSTDWESLTLQEVRLETEEGLSRGLGVRYFLDIAKMPSETANLRIYLSGSGLELATSIIYERSKLSAEELVTVLKNASLGKFDEALKSFAIPKALSQHLS